MINQEIFRSYDVRGIYPTEINEEAAFKVGQAMGMFVADEIVVGWDMRLSSPKIRDNFCRGVNSVGIDVVDIGMCTTPMLNFAVAHKKFKGGVMITASHNPPQYNGIKLIGERAIQFDKNKIQEIRQIAVGDIAESEKKGKIEKYDILPEYTDWLVGKFGQLQPVKIACDFGNGVGSIPAEPVFKALNITSSDLYFKPDGSYPNHAANPAEEKNLVDIKKEVLKGGYKFGVAFDGDSDRAFFIDETGRTVNVGFLLAALADNELKANHRGDKRVYYDLRFSKGVAKAIERDGGIPVKTKVGNPYYKQQLIMEGGLMGAEYSGHFMYAENYSLDDGLFSTLKVLYWLEKTGKKLSKFVEEFSRGYYLTGEINIEVKDAKSLIEKLEKKYSSGKIDKMDGVTIEFPDWWFNLRASNTEPVVRLNIEADSAELLAEKKKELEEFIKIN